MISFGTAIVRSCPFTAFPMTVRLCCSFSSGFSGFVSSSFLPSSGFSGFVSSSFLPSSGFSGFVSSSFLLSSGFSGFVSSSFLLSSGFSGFVSSVFFSLPAVLLLSVCDAVFLPALPPEVLPEDDPPRLGLLSMMTGLLAPATCCTVPDAEMPCPAT